METLIQIGYLVALVCFVLGIKGMSHPDTARRGNWTLALGMGLATLVTLMQPGLSNLPLILISLGLGSWWGMRMSSKAQMTEMPQMVSLLNGFGGLAAALVALSEVVDMFYGDAMANLLMEVMGRGALGQYYLLFYVVTLMISLAVGGISFTGSVMAMAKLDGKVSGQPLRFPMQGLVTNGLLVIMVLLTAAIATWPTYTLPLIVILMILSLVYGVLFVLPIGGADMPVVISFLNSLTGLTAATTGLLFDNRAMLMGGVLVGASGIYLTMLMCKAMNRTLGAVLLGQFNSGSGQAAREMSGQIKEIGLYDTAILLAYSTRVVVVPGYGLAVAQAQHLVHELEKILAAKGAECKYAIHPVAGRMPGHMNVLLAEADVSYDLLVEMEAINPDFPLTDVVLVIGAN
ncbi:MAG: NAD(P)(+) transhydrogenase (Re/Si-specific) subunit beta, partial [Cytophagia bacterium]|nr:NAD(P)(+) transhydrogenase (Re/Si-specific) subunit beta [Cytophagia bacterium]